jgi:hypothetical protein
MYAEYSALIDTALVTALAVIVWAAYREVRRRKDAPQSLHTGSTHPAS